MRQSCSWSALLLFCLMSAAGAAEGLRLDGIPDEPIWDQAMRFEDFRVVVPYSLAEPLHPTQVRLLSLPEGLAVAFHCAHPASTRRLKPRAARDASITADRVNFAVDFDADGRLAYNFTVSLSGAISDEVISNENQYRGDWDGDWQYAVHEAEDHWSVEMLIPWSIAAMRDEPSAQRRIAVYFDRVIASINERSASGEASFIRPRFVSDFTPIKVVSHPPRAEYRVVPYASVQWDQLSKSSELRSGVDLFWKPSGRLQLSAALNPDFGQIEADDLVISFDAIEVFFSDKRPFFTENQGIFELPTPDSGQLLYTRRMGAARDDGQGTADIDLALKLNGSLVGFDYGSLAVQEAEAGAFDGRSYFAQRLQRQFGDLSLGYLGTWVQRPTLDREAQVQALDGQWRPNAEWFLSGQVLGSTIDQGGQKQRGQGAWLRSFYAPAAHLQHKVEISHFDRDLDFNDLGFQRRASLNKLDYGYTHRRNQFAEDSRWRSVVWNTEAQLRYNDSGDKLPPVLFASRRAETRAGGIWASSVDYAWRGFDDLLSRGNGLVLLEPRLRSLYSWYESPRLERWKWYVGAGLLQEGQKGFAWQPELILSYFPNDELNLRLLAFPRWSRDWLLWREADRLASFKRRQMRLDFDLNWFPGTRHEFRLKTQWRAIDAFDPRPLRIAAGGRLEESTHAVAPFTANNFGIQLRYRYEFGMQRELYAVYGRGGFELAELDDGASLSNPRGLGSLFGDIADLRDADQLLVKLRWRL